jgi:hypothetical protein
MRARVWRTIKLFSGLGMRLRRCRGTAGIPQCPGVAQAQVTSGEDEGDLLDDGIGQLFSVLHANLLETGKQMIIVGCR